MNLLELQARKILNAPEEWKVFEWRSEYNQDFNGKITFVGFKLTGAVPSLYKRGSKKGKPNWKKLDKSTKRTVSISLEAKKKFEEEWSKETGLCPECQGEGKVFSRWNINEGTVYKVCKCSL